MSIPFKLLGISLKICICHLALKSVLFDLLKNNQFSNFTLFKLAQLY